MTNEWRSRHRPELLARRRMQRKAAKGGERVTLTIAVQRADGSRKKRVLAEVSGEPILIDRLAEDVGQGLPAWLHGLLRAER